MKAPDNSGERRECLIILEKVGWKQGLLESLVTDEEVSKLVYNIKAINNASVFFSFPDRYHR